MSQSESNEPGVPGVPDGLTAVDLDDASVRLEVEADLYPLEAVYGAAYTFIDRCYVFLDRPAAGRLRVTLGAKDPGAGADTLRVLVGEFANELLACAWRHDITRQNRAVIEAVTMQAFGGAMGPPSLDELEDFDFTDEQFDDPLGIATSWEEKYKKKPKGPTGPPGTSEEDA
jgi:His-Xaa-Ser system protein HxsD